MNEHIPPLGVMLKTVHDYKRVKDLNEAITRYLQDPELSIPESYEHVKIWAEEIVEICGREIK